MQVTFYNENQLLLRQHSGVDEGYLTYTASNLTNAVISNKDIGASISYSGKGKWHSHKKSADNPQLLAEISLRPGGIIYLQYHLHRKKYIIRKSGRYGGRFDLLNRKKEEILTVIPAINWIYRGHEYTIQVNEEYKCECTSLLILHTVHCANCLLGIINGSPVPALIDI